MDDINIMNIEPNYTMVFHGDDNEEVGKLDWNDGIMKFEGDTEESAKIFFNAFFDVFTGWKNDKN